MDDNRSIEVFAFNTGSIYIGEANESNTNDYVKNFFLKQTAVNGGTNYAPVMKVIVKQFGIAISEGGGLKKFFSRGIPRRKSSLLLFQLSSFSLLTVIIGTSLIQKK